MIMESLGKLFGSEARVKVMRLFLLNPETPFDAVEIAKRSKVSRANLSRELKLLELAGFAKRKSFFKELPPKKGKKVGSKKRMTGWQLEYGFPHLKAIRQLLVENSTFDKRDLASRFRPHGKLKLIVIAGVFIKNDESRADLLIVGDSFKKAGLENAIRSIESEIGRELVYVVFSTEDFLYRLDMQDKLVRDILDYPHEKVLDLTGAELSR